MEASLSNAKHRKTPGKQLNVLSYSYQVLSGSNFASGFTKGDSLNILTWQQVIGEEKSPNLFASVRGIFVEKYILMEDNPNIYCYSMHYGKIIYLPTKHALFNC